MNRMLWMDFEMTGLDPSTCGIIEVAAIVTDLKLNAIATYHSVVFQPPELIAQMDEWNQKTHGESGLIDEIAHGKTIDEVECDLIAFIQQHCPDERPVICGNSIHQDRRFIHAYLPRFDGLLHYRMIDVSAFKQVYRHMFDISFAKQGGHRALDDILESIEELKHYLTFIHTPENATT